MIDPDGFRPNVGIVLMHPDGRVFWARRVRRDGWQFPQGGMNTDETPLEAMYRELREETGLLPEHVAVLGATPGWLRYRLPQRAIRRNDRIGFGLDVNLTDTVGIEKFSKNFIFKGLTMHAVIGRGRDDAGQFDAG